MKSFPHLERHASPRQVPPSPVQSPEPQHSRLEGETRDADGRDERKSTTAEERATAEARTTDAEPAEARTLKEGTTEAEPVEARTVEDGTVDEGTVDQRTAEEGTTEERGTQARTRFAERVRLGLRLRPKHGQIRRRLPAFEKQLCYHR